MSRVRRSILAMPVVVRRFVENAWRRKADAVLLDLEDAVAPAERARARALVREALPLVTAGGAEAWVRVNRESVEEDCEASVWPGLTGIVLPKTESAEEVAQADSIIGRLEAERGIAPGATRIAATVETARGVRNAHAIAAASLRSPNPPNLSPNPLTLSLSKGAAGVVVGETGLAADLGLPLDAPWDADALTYARGEADLAARALGLPVQGHRGAVVLHPMHVEAANRAFTPRTEEAQEALAVVYAFEEADRRGEAYGVHRGRIVDARVAAAARDLLVYAEECAARDAEHVQRAMLLQQAAMTPPSEGEASEQQPQPSDPDAESPQQQPADAEGDAARPNSW